MAAPRARDGILTVVATIAIVVLALLPDLGPRIVTEGAGIKAFHGRIVSIEAAPADDPIAAPTATVVYLDGPEAGTSVRAFIEGPGGSQTVADYHAGDEVVVTVTIDQDGKPYVAVSDQWRAPLLGVFVLVFALGVVLVGGVRGIRALVSLGLTIALILKVLIPLVVSGVAPVPLAVFTATVLTIVSILLTEGWNRASAAAIVGTSGALALTGLLGAVGTALASFTYSAGSDLAFLQTSDGRGLDLRGMLLAAFILGAAGVLDDVTVTQAAVIDSLASHGASGARLIQSALAVGRSHIAATVNTLFLAYVGAALPLIVTLVVGRQPLALVLNSEEVATEVIRTLVGSLGILAAVPFTTFVAAALIDRPRDRDRLMWDARRLALPASTAVIAIALVLTVTLPLGGTRAPLRQDTFGPSSVPGGIAGSIAPSAGTDLGGPSAPTRSAEPTIIATGEPYVMLVGDTVIDVTVQSIKAARSSAGWLVSVEVEYEVEGPGSFTVDASAWSLITTAGEDVALDPSAEGGLRSGPLGEGQTRRGSLEGTVSSGPTETFATYTDVDGTVAFAIPVDAG
ncbi:MAG TPA: YibE/F family protein [Candidatus Limnocylindrales bacterium]|nr:YibE/F family protein [Candidatus Limnocylindrales bacterium]